MKFYMVSLFFSCILASACKSPNTTNQATSNATKIGLTDSLKRIDNLFDNPQSADYNKDMVASVEELAASEIVEKAAKKGDKAIDFELPDYNNKVVKLSDLYTKNYVILTWYRGSWCPYCNAQLHFYQQYLRDFKKQNAVLVAISPQLPDKTVVMVKQSNLDFEILTDQDLKVAHQYGVAYKLPKRMAKHYEFINEENGNKNSELPLAVTYIIDKQGLIQYAFLDTDARHRAAPEEILTILKSLNQKKN